MPSPTWRASTARRCTADGDAVSGPSAPATSTGTVSPPASASNFTGSSSPAGRACVQAPGVAAAAAGDARRRRRPARS